LANLLKIGQLKEHPRDPKEIHRILTAARRSLADARVAGLSAESRLDLAYRVITQVGLAALMARGFRPDTNRPGHHVTIIRTLSLTLGVEGRRITLLDTFRRKRNRADYEGYDIDDDSAAACVEEAARLLRQALAALGPRK
jgi:hypothetical protein